MADLYFIFFLVGALLFAGIVGYSVLQQRRYSRPAKDEYVDPLFAELEEQKGGEKTVVEPPALKGANAPPSEQSPPRSSGRSARSLKNKTAPTVSASGMPSAASDPSIAASSDPSLSAPPAAAEASVVPDLSVQKGAQKDDSKVVAQSAANLEEAALDVDPSSTNTVEPQAEVSGAPKLDEKSSTVVTDLVARVKNPEAIEQQGLLALFRKHDFKFHRKVHIYGLNQLTDIWSDIEFESSSARFVELGVSIQLTDREGAMSKKELHDFQQMVLEFANSYDAPFEFSMDIDESLKQAQLLDQIGRRYDSMAVLNVVPRSKAGFRMADIESCATDLMMSMDKNGVFMKTRSQKSNLSVLFRLACTDGSGHFGISSGTITPVHDLVVYMNVPATEDPELVFQEMVKDANSLATWLDGKVVDRNGRVMTQRSYSVLMQQISDIAFSMQQDGLTPGDAISKKLF